MSTQSLEVWTVYFSPKDAPGRFVARRFDIQDGVVRRTSIAFHAATLEGVRLGIPRGLYRTVRAPGDEPHIVEVWC